MLKPLLSFISGLLLTLFFAGNLQAQHACLPTGRYFMPYWDSDAVFIGMAVGVSDLEDKRIVTFSVEKPVRGTKDRTIQITTESKNGYGFVQGERYFVYAFRGTDKSFYVGACSKTVLLKDAADDLEYAADIAAGKPGTRIHGSVIEDRWKLGEQWEYVPLAGIKVSIENEKNRFSTQTDEQGKYVFKNIPAGLYTVKVDIPDDLRDKKDFPKIKNGFVPNGLYRDRKLKPNQVYIGWDRSSEPFSVGDSSQPPAPRAFYRYSDSLSFQVTSLGSVRGKFVSHDGEKPPQVFVRLVPVGTDGKVILDDDVAYMWTNPETGEFYFERVPEGKYMVVVNRYNCHTNVRPEYGRNFHPGTSDANEARVITVRSKQDIELDDFRLPPPLKEKWVTGVVLSADKKPVADATVRMWAPDQRYFGECVSGNSISTSTDANGRFRVKGYESYRYKISAYKESGGQDLRTYSEVSEMTLSEEPFELIFILDQND